jgi:hypothetical protein
MTRIHEMLLYIAVIAGVVFSPHSLLGKTWLVPAECPTIHAGLDSAAAGDTVLVATGVYPVTEDPDTWITLKSGIVLLSEGGAAATVIEYCGVSSGVGFQSCEGTVLSGFTIRMGDGPGCHPPMGHTHCIICYDCTDIAVYDCIIENGDYGIYVTGESLLWWKPVFGGNVIRHCSIGVGCYDIYEPGRPFFLDNEISECGIGVEVLNSCPNFDGNSIEYCQTYGMYFWGATGGNCDRNVIAHNESYGVYIYCDPPLAAPDFNGSWVPELANEFYDNGGTDIWYHYASPTGFVMALYNYWGSKCPDFQSEVHGGVNYSPWVDSSHTVILTQEDCPGATAPSTWGSIKALYR